MEVVSDELLDLIADLAARQAKAHGLTIPVAVAVVKRELAKARAAYLLAGAPYGDDDRGFVLWLTRPPMTPAA